MTILDQYKEAQKVEQNLVLKYEFIKRYVLIVIGELMATKTEPTLATLEAFSADVWERLQILDDYFGKQETGILIRSAILELWATQSLGIHEGLIYLQI